MEAAREATAADLPAIRALADEAAAATAPVRGGALHLVGEGLAEPYGDTVAVALTDPAALLLVGTIDDVPVGFCLVRDRALRDGSLVAFVEALYVGPEAREVGVGEAIMDAVLAWAGAHGCIGVDAVALPGDRATKNFFESFGLVARAILVHRSIEEGPIEDG